jgi:hypothetical protein
MNADEIIAGMENGTIDIKKSRELLKVAVKKIEADIGKRDYFAARLASAFIVAGRIVPADIAVKSYELADAMIAQSQK